MDRRHLNNLGLESQGKRPSSLRHRFLPHHPTMSTKASVFTSVAHSATIRAFQRRLIGWYQRHGRDLPWRRTRDPYAILVSEVMLQQTQVSRAKLYYERFLRRYPTVEDLAQAEEDEVRETWEGLGYYHRARNLQRASREIVAKHKGRFPQTHEELTALPGIGDYTAGAVRSFAFHHDAAILDTNAARVLTRFFALPLEQQTHRFLWSVAQQVTPPKQAHIFNQAIMDLGATICIARAPRCTACPVRAVCRSVRKQKQAQLLE
jgi:A/G-specific adenine glycosylase